MAVLTAGAAIKRPEPGGENDMTTTRRIDTIRRQLQERGIRYHMQGGTVIKTTGTEERHEAPMHHSVTSIEQAVAGDAHRVLGPGECLPKRWQQYQPD